MPSRTASMRFRDSRSSRGVGRGEGQWRSLPNPFRPLTTTARAAHHPEPIWLSLRESRKFEMRHRQVALGPFPVAEHPDSTMWPSRYRLEREQRDCDAADGLRSTIP